MRVDRRPQAAEQAAGCCAPCAGLGQLDINTWLRQRQFCVAAAATAAAGRAAPCMRWLSGAGWLCYACGAAC